MGIALACPSCGARMEYQDADAGRGGQCPTCKAEIQVPQHTKMCVGCRRHVALEVTNCPACGTALAPGGPPRPVTQGPAPVMMTPPMMSPGDAIGEPQTSGKAVTSLVLGIMSIVLFCLTGVPAIIVGILAFSDIRRAAGRMKGSGMATAGIVAGGFGCVIMICLAPALLLPAVQAAREAARRTQCRNNLHMIGLAMHNYSDTYNSLPPAYTVDAQGRPLLSWRVLILPFINEPGLYSQFHLDEPWDSPHNLGLSALMPAMYGCSSEPSQLPDRTSYAAISGPGTIFPPDRAVNIREITDGTAMTAMVGEVRGGSIVWTQPVDVPFTAQFKGPGDFTSWHPGGWNMLMADGSVRFFSDNIDTVTLRGLMTISGDETVPSF